MSGFIVVETNGERIRAIWAKLFPEKKEAELTFHSRNKLGNGWKYEAIPADDALRAVYPDYAL